LSESDGDDHFRELGALAEAGKYKEALDKHIWFHEASKEFSGMGGVRLSYALDLWMDLAGKYEPAMDGFLALRTSLQEKLFEGVGDSGDFHDLSAINQTLGDSEDTVRVFMTLHDQFPDQAKRVYHIAEKLLVENKYYDVCAIYLVDAKKKYAHIQHMHEMNVDIANKNPDMGDEFDQYTKDSYVSEVCQLIEILVALKRNDEAADIQRSALTYFDDEAIRIAVGK